MKSRELYKGVWVDRLASLAMLSRRAVDVVNGKLAANNEVYRTSYYVWKENQENLDFKGLKVKFLFFFVQPDEASESVTSRQVCVRVWSTMEHAGLKKPSTCLCSF